MLLQNKQHISMEPVTWGINTKFLFGINEIRCSVTLPCRAGSRIAATRLRHFSPKRDSISEPSMSDIPDKGLKQANSRKQMLEKMIFSNFYAIDLIGIIPSN